MKEKHYGYSFPLQEKRTWRAFLEEEEVIKSCERCGCILPKDLTKATEYSIYEQRLLCAMCSMHESYL
ncbi:hypothetical protein SM124_14040 [Bacillus sp. 31A1R]|uniref:Uncharacterized protein n=1 Tax=Robertmurraya mangrovi TaxID=3098077 RepID=A0ABU5J0A8_9BACI|nr:hypothetical protein [Bacillus sp. 31A1R]MDZ5472849.1 hypothetical protein [Bacillus sp. 31A1R]